MHIGDTHQGTVYGWYDRLDHRPERDFLDRRSSIIGQQLVCVPDHEAVGPSCLLIPVILPIPSMSGVIYPCAVVGI